MDPVNIPAKFEVRSFTCSWDNRGTSKIWGVPGFAHPPYSPKFLKGFCSHGPCEYTAKFEVRSFTQSWDNRGYSKNWAFPGYAHAPFSLFSIWPWSYFRWIPTYVITVPDRYRRTDGQTDESNLNTALCTSASRGKNWPQCTEHLYISRNGIIYDMIQH